jgi:hypothetical protein
MRKKFICLIVIILATVIFTSGFLASCGDKSVKDANAPTAANAENDADDAAPGVEDTANKLTAPNLPDTDWKGKVITFIVRGPDFNEWESQDIYVEEENGEPVNDAVYKRNAILEDRYNFIIKQFPGTSAIQSQAEKSMRSGSNDYQVLMCDTVATSNLAMKGYLSDLRKVNNLDLSREYWDQNSIYGFTVGGKTLFMTGDLSIMANDATWIFMFNKELHKNLGLEDPYALVRNGNWTADKLYEMVKATAKDLNGDGVMKIADDMFGLVMESTFEGLFFSMGMRVSTMNAEGYPELSMNNERITRVMEKTATIMGKDIAFKGDWQAIGKCFEEDRTLFYGEVLQCVIRRRSMDTDFGVMPLPKLDEKQEDYSHIVHKTACMVGVPNSLSEDDIAFAGFVLEAMAAESRNWLVPAYYTTALEGKFMRDEESKEMLDVILRTRRYDLGYVADWGGLFGGYVTASNKGSTDFASVWDKSSPKAMTAMEKDINAYRDIP